MPPKRLKLVRDNAGLDKIYDEKGVLIIPSDLKWVTRWRKTSLHKNIDGQIVAKSVEDYTDNKIVVKFSINWWIQIILASIVGAILGGAVRLLI